MEEHKRCLSIWTYSLKTSLDAWFEAGETEEEACLYLNIWPPAPDSARRPVMVWLHGGNFLQRAGSLPL
ncbi:MAG TPA: carboxylesterase family protein [Thermoanaerobacterales bacterium]|nr:carboxylesterase family protein [Thermoanaerobacterales bacterium]